MSFRLRCGRRRHHTASPEEGAIFLQDDKTVCTSVKCQEGVLVKDVIKEVCRCLDIPPLARFFFALCNKESGIPLSPFSCLTKQESASQYRLRVFVNIANSCYLQSISMAAYDYYYKQSCHEFVHCNCLHPHVTLNSAVWMAAINMAKDAKVTGKSFKDFQADADRYMPKFLLRRYKRDYKVRKKLEEVFECFAKLDVDSSHYVQKFLDVFEKDEMCGHHVFPLKKPSVSLLKEESEHVTISWKEGINVIGVVRRMKNCQELMCFIADIATVTADLTSCRLTVSKTDKSNFDLYFTSARDLVGFSTIVQGYWWMKVDGSQTIFRGDMAPLIEESHCRMISGTMNVLPCPYHYNPFCYAPITDDAVHSILKEHFTEGNFVVRQSRTTDDTYTLCVCHDMQIIHYRIIRGEDGFYHFKNQKDTLKGHQKFSTLHDLIKNHKHRTDGLPTFLRSNISPEVGGKVPLLPPVICEESDRICSKSEHFGVMWSQPRSTNTLIQCRLCQHTCRINFARLCENCDKFYCMNCAGSPSRRERLCSICQPVAVEVSKRSILDSVHQDSSSDPTCSGTCVGEQKIGLALTMEEEISDLPTTPLC